jgi:hypothetical protein
MKLPNDTENLFNALRQSAKPKPVSAIEKLIHDAPDRELCRINALAFAAGHGLDEDDVLAAFLHGARLGVSICRGTSFVYLGGSFGVSEATISSKRGSPRSGS